MKSQLFIRNVFLFSLLVTLMSECLRTVCWKQFRSRTNWRQDLIGQFTVNEFNTISTIKSICQFFYTDEWLCDLCRLMPIQQCELVLVHIFPQGDDTLVSDRQKKEVKI